MGRSRRGRLQWTGEAWIPAFGSVEEAKCEAEGILSLRQKRRQEGIPPRGTSPDGSFYCQERRAPDLRSIAPLARLGAVPQRRDIRYTAPLRGVLKGS